MRESHFPRQLHTAGVIIAVCTLFKNALADDFSESHGSSGLPMFWLVDMHMSCTEEAVKEEIIKAFTISTKLHTVATTVAFGMGVHCFGFKEVIYLGLQDDNM